MFCFNLIFKEFEELELEWGHFSHCGQRLNHVFYNLYKIANLKYKNSQIITLK